MEVDVRNAESSPWLDAAVSEVLGHCAHIWEIRHREIRYCACCGQEVQVDNGDYIEKICAKCGKEVSGLVYNVDGIPDCKPYSTVVSAAWEAVEKMKELGYDFSFHRMEDFDWLYLASYKGPGTDGWKMIKAATASVAICRMFLLLHDTKVIEVPDKKETR